MAKMTSAYWSLMKLDGFFERLANAKIPNFDFAHFRYKLQDGNYRWVEQCVITGEENGLPLGMFRLYVFDIHNLMTRRIGTISDESSVISVGRDQKTGLYTSKDFFSQAEQIVKKNRDKEPRSPHRPSEELSLLLNMDKNFRLCEKVSFGTLFFVPLPLVFEKS